MLHRSLGLIQFTSLLLLSFNAATTRLTAVGTCSRTYSLTGCFSGFIPAPVHFAIAAIIFCACSFSKKAISAKLPLVDRNAATVFELGVYIRVRGAAATFAVAFLGSCVGATVGFVLTGGFVGAVVFLDCFVGAATFAVAFLDCFVGATVGFVLTGGFVGAVVFLDCFVGAVAFSGSCTCAAVAFVVCFVGVGVCDGAFVDVACPAVAPVLRTVFLAEFFDLRSVRDGISMYFHDKNDADYEQIDIAVSLEVVVYRHDICCDVRAVEPAIQRTHANIHTKPYAALGGKGAVTR